MTTLTQVIDTIAQGKIKLVHKNITYSTRFEFEEMPNSDRTRINIIPTYYIKGAWLDVPEGQIFLEGVILSGDYELIDTVLKANIG